MISGDSKLCGRKQDQEKVRQIGRKWKWKISKNIRIFYKYKWIDIVSRMAEEPSLSGNWLHLCKQLQTARQTAVPCICISARVSDQIRRTNQNAIFVRPSYRKVYVYLSLPIVWRFIALTIWSHIYIHIYTYTYQEVLPAEVKKLRCRNGS